MATDFATQSKRLNVAEKIDFPPKANRPTAAQRVWTTAEWLAYFRANAARCRPIPWHRGAETSPDQLDAIARSLQAWQLGESSDGRHLMAASARYAVRIGDPDYLAVVELFIREE